MRFFKVCMKISIFCFLFYSLQSVACSENYLKSVSGTEKFLSVVEDSPVVFVGEIIRLYRTPSVESVQQAKNGFVLKVLEPIKGKLPAYVEMERGWRCGVNNPYQNGYWPEEVGQRFIVAGYLKEEGVYTSDIASAVFPYKNSLALMQAVYSMANKSLKLDD